MNKKLYHVFPTRDSVLATIEAVEELIKQAKKLEVVREGYGVCMNLDLKTKRFGICGYAVVRYGAKGWEYHTLDKDYPVPDEDYNVKWTGQSLELRLDLLRHLEKELHKVADYWVD